VQGYPRRGKIQGVTSLGEEMMSQEAEKKITSLSEEVTSQEAGKKISQEMMARGWHHGDVRENYIMGNYIAQNM